MTTPNIEEIRANLRRSVNAQRQLRGLLAAAPGDIELESVETSGPNLPAELTEANTNVASGE